MNRRELQTWAIVIGLLVVSGLATAVWPRMADALGVGSGSFQRAEIEEETPPIVINVESFLLGRDLLAQPVIGDRLAQIDGTELSQAQAAGLLVGITVVALGAVGLPLAGAYVLLDRQARATLEDEAFQAAQSKLEQRNQEEIKALKSAKPPTPVPEVVEMPRWSVISTSLTILLFVWFAGLALSQAYFPEDGGTVTGILVLATAVILFFYFRGKRPGVLDSGESDQAAVSWGWVWVIVSGLLIVGVGAGLAIALRAAPAG